ncbi:MAG: hypothetical protein IJW49_02340 [Clostridia bacterium]|nr:hypothetical protein [Clostridia bacterium]
MAADNKYLELARSARKENNSEDAKKFYDMARVEDPENGEAKFFYQYYSLYEGKNNEIARRFINLINGIPSSIKCVVNSGADHAEKLETIREIVEAYVPMTWSLNRYMNNLTVGSGQNRTRVLSNAEITSTCVAGVIGLYATGDLLQTLFNGDAAAMKIAAIAWKEGVSLQQKWYAYKYDGKTAEEYAEKIKKVEPDYEMPKKAGCISFG